MIAPHRESGIVLDIGTGDGRFVSSSARSNPHEFFIGIDANPKPLEKLSTKITRKHAKGGLPNAMFVQAAVENMPEEFAGVADEIFINFPWGSLLSGVVNGDSLVLHSIRNLLADDGSLIVTLGIDPVRDRTELDRLGITHVDLGYLGSTLADRYRGMGLRMVKLDKLDVAEWSRIGTSWARKLGGNEERRVFRLRFIRIDHPWKLR